MLKEVQRDQGLTVMLLLSAAALLFLVVREFGTNLPGTPSAPTNGVATVRLPTRGFEGIFDPGRFPSLALHSNESGNFYTSHFQPPAAPKPKPPTTRRVDLTYLGFLEAGGGPRRAVVDLAGQQTLVPAGSNLIANLAVGGIELRTLTLTNPEAVSHILQFNVKTNLEVPLP